MGLIVLLTASLLLSGIEDTKNQSIDITEDIFYDPLCVTPQNMIQYLNFDPLVLCKYTDWGGINMGSSVNIDDNNGDTSYNVRSFILKIHSVPKSDFFHQVTILDGQLLLKIRDNNSSNNNPLDYRFLLFKGLCTSVSWNEKSLSDKVPCINKDKRPETTLRIFDEPIKTLLITDVKIDVKQHLEYAQQNDLESFTEIIEFYPIQFIVNSQNFNSEQRTCIYHSQNVTALTNCVKNLQVTVFTSENEIGNGPRLNLIYNVKPTSQMQAWNTSLLAIVPVIISIIIYRNRQIEEHNSKMRTACETIKSELIDIKEGLTGRYEHFNEAYIVYDKDSEPLKFNLSDEIHLVYLPRDVYLSTIHSGIFLNFKSINQTRIVSLYQKIKQYTEKQIYLEKIQDDAKKQIKNNDHDLEHTEWYLEKITGKYYEYLGKLRKEILSDIDDVHIILDEEFNRFSEKDFSIKMIKIPYGRK